MEALYMNRFNANGLYILDEPEASLSPQRQLRFIIRICDLARQGAQFLIATHSPLIIFTPGCSLLELADGRLGNVDARRTDLVNLYKTVISSSGEYLNKAVDDCD
jgi:predicted ATPase